MLTDNHQIWANLKPWSVQQQVPHKLGTAQAERDFLRMQQGRQEFNGKRKKSGIQNSFIAGHPRGKNPGDFWSIATKPFKEAHFAVFPEQLIEKPILVGCPDCPCSDKGASSQKCDAHSGHRVHCKGKCRRGIVLDPFMGSGTTAVVARRLGRDFIGFEPNPEYVKIARKRLKQSQQGY